MDWPYAMISKENDKDEIDHLKQQVEVKNATTNPQEVNCNKRLFTDDEPFDYDTKRRKLTGEDRLKRNRERNKFHARKTRERKKKQLFAYQQRIR